jgi:Flp pilus assembly protein TadD
VPHVNLSPAGVSTTSPRWSNVAERLARALKRLRRGDLAAAEHEVRAALRLAPDDAVAHNVLGLVLAERRDHAGAVDAFSAAIRLKVPFPEALINLAMVCNRTGRHEFALRVCELALAASPGNALALVNQGMAWKGLRRLAEAKRAFELAGEHPMARFNLGHTLLLENNLERGLPLYEERRTVLHTGAGLRGRAWTGEARPGDTLLVAPEQGLGDFLLMSRFFATLADRFARVIVHSPAPLASLIATLDPRLEVVTTLERARWDVWAPIMSLPLLLGVRRLEDVPTAPWLGAGLPDVPRERPRVGLNWAGNPAFAYDAVRSTSLDTFAPLLAIGGVEWVSLHRGAREHEAEAHGLAQPLREARDFLDTAAVLRGLDLVISTETALPNLSAAMGVPTCVLSVKDVDWRWTGWYRGVTVCDQDTPGDWSGPLAKAAAVLARCGSGARVEPPA